ncbi:MAG: cupin domain-containing protein, partial [Pseudomonadota bacterium]
GHDANGQSKFIMDGDAPTVIEIESMGGLGITDLWETFDSPADNSGDADNADRAVHLEPDAMGSIFRIVEFPPDSAWKDGGDGAEAFAQIQASHAADADSADPAMHKTDTVDYALVLDGEIWAVMDTEERLMKAGDSLVQRGTNHAWANRTEEICRVMFVLTGAKPA